MSPRRAVAAAATLVTIAAAGAVVPTAAAISPRSYTAAELSSAKQALDVRLASPPDGITSWYVDPATNRVKVSVMAGDSTALAAARRSISGLPGATIETVTQRPRPLYDLVGGQAIYSAATAGRCSLGFSARDKAGATYVLTAGHCTKGSTSWKGYNQVTMGSVFRSDYPGDDFGSIRVTSNWVPTAKVATSSATVSVTGSVEAAVSAKVCRSGSTSGYQCGSILAKNVTVNYLDGAVVSGLTRTNVCAAPGDSGGSWISGTQAQGVTSGGSGNCTSGGITYFQPVNEILTRYGLTLVTQS